MFRPRRLAAFLAIFAIAGFASQGASSASTPPVWDTAVTQQFALDGGRTLFFGLTGSESGKRTYFLSRLDEAGRVDPTYGDDGYTLSPELGKAFDDNQYFALSAGATADGALLIGAGPRIFRFTPDGKPDMGFGQDGSILHGVDYGTNGWLATSADGHIAVSGQAVSAQTDPWALPAVRVFDPDGRPDEDFSEDGIRFLPLVSFPGSGEQTRVVPSAVKFDSAGRIVESVSYSTTSPSSDGSSEVKSGAGVFRFNPDGQGDPSFGDGQGFAQLAGPHDGMRPGYDVEDVELGEDGSLALLGSAVVPKGPEYVEVSDFIATAGPDGADASGPVTPRTSDGTFGLSDIAVNGARGVYGALDSQPPVWTGTNLVTTLAAGRFGSDGLLDPAFGDGGLAIEKLGDLSLANSIEIDSEGRPVFAGFAQVKCAGRVAAFVRVDATGRPDPSFGDEGVATIPDIETLVPKAKGCGPRRVRPVVHARFKGHDFARSRLVVDLGAAPREHGVPTGWTAARIVFPRMVHPRAKWTNAITVRSGYGPKAPGVARRMVGLKGRVLTIRRAWDSRADRLRVVVPRRALGPVPRRARGRALWIAASFRDWFGTGGSGSPPTKGSARVHVPR